MYRKKNKGYRKNKGLDCKNHANGWAGRRAWGSIVKHLLKSLKKMLKCLIFNGLVH
jgi:hypothetical protein